MSLSRSSASLGSQHHLSMGSSESKTYDAKQLVNRVCRALSEKTGCKISPFYSSNGRLYLVEKTSKSCVFVYRNSSSMSSYFNSASSLLEWLLSKGVSISVYPHKKRPVHLDLAPVLGTNIDELIINLDLMNC